VLHVLVQARVEPGLADEVELAPTVQATADTVAAPFLTEVRRPDPARVRFRAVLSEEGGRFLNAENDYLIVETEQRAEPPGFRWMTPAQLANLVRRSHYVNVQARSLLACLNATGIS
jgi:oxidase EvaA